jgi:hypothetical protein
MPDRYLVCAGITFGACRSEMLGRKIEDVAFAEFCTEADLNAVWRRATEAYPASQWVFDLNDPKELAKALIYAIRRR